jgi:hypothetical protein
MAAKWFNSLDTNSNLSALFFFYVGMAERNSNGVYQ